jgi:pantetheine-phosphate adenylyltransferase
MKEFHEWENDLLFYIAIFHDIVYDPLKKDNEEESIELFNLFAQLNHLSDDDIRLVSDVILDTKIGNSPRSGLAEHFIKLDRYNLIYGDYRTVLERTMLLFKEQQFMDFPIWKEKTILFLNQFADTNPNIKNVISYLEIWTPKIGIYAGSFNPFHKGHLNILQKAERIFDKIIIARGCNPEKGENDLWELPDVLKYHQIEKFDGFLTKFMDNLGYETTLIRGLRNSTDLQYEMTQFQYLQDMKKDINIVNIFCDKEFEHISSSAIRNLTKLDKRFGDKYLI